MSTAIDLRTLAANVMRDGDTDLGAFFGESLPSRSDPRPVSGPATQRELVAASLLLRPGSAERR